MILDSSRERHVGRTRRLAGALALLALGLLLVALAVGRIGRYKVISNSMYPTLHVGDYVLAAQGEEYQPQRGDIVVFWDPEVEEPTFGADEQLTKRIVGLPGETVYFDVDSLRVGDYDYSVPQWKIASSPFLESGRVKIGAEEIFLLGDNQENSHDSVYFGSVPLALVFGQVKFVYWPLEHAGFPDSVAELQAKEIDQAEK